MEGLVQSDDDCDSSIHTPPHPSLPLPPIYHLHPNRYRSRQPGRSGLFSAFTVVHRNNQTWFLEVQQILGNCKLQELELESRMLTFVSSRACAARHSNRIRLTIEPEAARIEVVNDIMYELAIAMQLIKCATMHSAYTPLSDEEKLQLRPLRESSPSIAQLQASTRSSTVA